MKLRTKRGVAAVLLLLVVTGAALASVQSVRWRTQLVWMKLRGDLVITSWSDVITALQPGNPARANISRLLETGNPVLSNFVTSEDSTEGAGLFRSRCASCHGPDARGATAPRLTGRHGRGAEMQYRVIENGIPGTDMLGTDLPSDDIWRLVAFLRSIREENGQPTAVAENAPAPPGVTPERLRNSKREPRNWLTYSGSYDSHRHSRLDRITAQNVGRLQTAWIRQLDTDRPMVEATPLVVDGTMYLTEPPGNVLALDASTGRALWRNELALPERLKVCCGQVNRGLAVLGDRLYMGTLDARLVALDASSGRVIWEVPVADYRTGHSITAAPLAVGDQIVVGIAGGEYGIRGFLDAYDAETGERTWRFWTVPGPGEPGHDTWEGDSWRQGGAPTWVTGSYDPDLGLIYWGVGNPGPPWYGEDRTGDNLYSNSVVALDARTGALRWHFQFTPHDLHDWDATQVPVLLDAPFEGTSRKLMAWANRNAFYYLLDRTTGEFLLARPFAKQTWAERIDARGRPVRLPGTEPSAEGTLVSPAGSGATNWWSPAYNADTGLLYVPTIPESSAAYFSQPPEYQPGDLFLGSGFIKARGEAKAAIRAIRPLSGEIAWEYVFPDPLGLYRIGGVLTTAGDLVFAGAVESFVALRASDGQELWSFDLGGSIVAAPVTYEVDGRQFVAIAGGRAVFAFALPEAGAR